MSFQQKSNYLSTKATIDLLKRFTQGVEGKIDAKLYNVANKINDTAWNNALKRSGNMANKTVVRSYSGNGGKGYEVAGTAPYTRSYHEGRGTHAAYGKRPYIKDAFEKHKKEATTWTAKEIGLGSGTGSWA